MGDFCPVGTGIHVSEEGELKGEGEGWGEDGQEMARMEEGEDSDDMVIGGESEGGEGVGGGEAEEEEGE